MHLSKAPSCRSVEIARKVLQASTDNEIERHFGILLPSSRQINLESPTSSTNKTTFAAIDDGSGPHRHATLQYFFPQQCFASVLFSARIVMEAF